MMPRHCSLTKCESGGVGHQAKTARSDVALIGELARQRMERMLDGPGPDGRYFASVVALTRSEIEEALGRRKRPHAQRERRPRPKPLALRCRPESHPSTHAARSVAAPPAPR
jgi:hypothetical protein